MIEAMIPEMARRLYEERLQEAENYRRAQRAQRYQPGVVKVMQFRLSQFLIDLGMRLKPQAEMRPGLS